MQLIFFSYLHSQFFPPVSHCNIKAANILLDEELLPLICDSGLAVLRPLTSNSVKLKVSPFRNCFHVCTYFINKICSL